MPPKTRWNENSDDSAAIFGAIHRGLIPVAAPGALTDLSTIANNWLNSHTELRAKYGAGDDNPAKFQAKFYKNFKNIVNRYKSWKDCARKKKYMVSPCFLLMLCFVLLR